MANYCTDLARRWRSLSILWKLIVVNIAVFAVIRLIGIAAIIGGFSINPVVDALALPPSLQELGYRPWTLLTYMFTHYDPLHIMFNMLALFWFGKLLTWRCTPRQLMALYIYGGIGGGLLFLLASAGFDTVATPLLGASASVMALLIALALIMPDFEVSLMLIGRVKLKWLAVGAIVLFALGLAGNNAGGHVAHFGGIIVGAIFGLMMNRGVDITSPLNKAIDWVVTFVGGVKAPRRKKQKFYKSKEQPRAKQSAKATEADRQKLDAILDKIKKSGYSSLTDDERRQLFDVSSRIK